MGSNVTLLLLLFPYLSLRLISAQQVGSFFTAIYLNGAPVSSNQLSCGSMGQPNYCCASGQSCEWDDGGRVACCASGTTCQGSAYGAGAAGAGQYYSPPSSSWYPQQQTTTIYQAQSQGCNPCGAPNNYNGPVVPIVPVTVATVVTPQTTTYYQVPTSTYPQIVSTTTTATTVVGAAVAAANNAACPSGYKTFTEANVGAPVRTVGCNVIYDSGGWRPEDDLRKTVLIAWILGLGVVLSIA